MINVQREPGYNPWADKYAKEKVVMGSTKERRKMNYVIGDVHNDNEKLNKILKMISVNPEDHVYFLGDLFDRCNSHPDPVGVYFNVLKLGEQATVLMGNHDKWLANYIKEFYSLSERKRRKMREYPYNTFELLRERLTDVDIMRLAEFIDTFPAQIELHADGRTHLLAHARTSAPEDVRDEKFYLMGMDDTIRVDEDMYYKDGVPGFTSICGHTETSLIGSMHGGSYSEHGRTSIWRNEKNNLILLDCGCGFEDGRLACICLETGEEFYA
ncbi:metallophosphoesterase [Butyrivibrio sp. VCB2001]|uniref:metallophosphoesterase n=1 Tax=Butyrivibrio sp. VCB2001 TaxID=1280667 RepID=UPI00040FDE43|nr:metallophosphoesterase [Butyrivibrio sp. VCB2001]